MPRLQSGACNASTDSRRPRAPPACRRVESDGDLSQMTVSRGATNAGATRPSRSRPATTDPTACTQPEPLACATPAQTNNSSAVPATGPKARSGSARCRKRAVADRFPVERTLAPARFCVPASWREAARITASARGPARGSPAPAAIPASKAPTGPASVTRRWASTLTATAFTSSGSTKPRPAITACARAAASRPIVARGLAPRRMRGSSRLARTIATA